MKQELKDQIIMDIQEAEDKEVSETTIPCVFYGTRITQRITVSQTVGYKLIEDYVWEAAYNTANELGGYACVEIIQSLEECEV